MSATADIVVVGGGSTGASIAFSLVAGGQRNILLLERESIASGQTGRSSAVIRMHYAAAPLVRLAVYSLRVFQRFGEIVGDECGYTPCGYTAIVGSGEHQAFEHNIRMQQENGAPTSRVEPADLRRLMPKMYVDDLRCGAYEPESGYADPVLTTQALVSRARQYGAGVRPNTAVRRVVHDGQGVSGLETDGGTIETRCVVLCVGVWTALVLGPLGIDLPIGVIRGEMTVFERPPELESHLVVHDVDQAMYLRPEGQWLTQVGMTDHRHLPATVDPDSYQEGASPATVEAAAAKFVHRFPIMADGRARRGYAGLYDVTPDLAPIMEETPIRGLFIAAGFSGQGFKIAPAVGALVARLVTGGGANDVGVDVDLFSSRRFAEGRLIRGPDVYRKDVVASTGAASSW